MKPKTGTWVAGGKNPDCPSIEPANYRFFYLVQRPAVRTDIPKQKLMKTLKLKQKKVQGNIVLSINKLRYLLHIQRRKIFFKENKLYNKMYQKKTKHKVRKMNPVKIVD